MRILVVEDHATLGRSLSNGLREENYAVDLASNGPEAVHLMKGTSYDCVVLDLMLPGKSGLDVLAEMRQRGDRSPVLCLTAMDALKDRVHALDLGADDYLVKPFEWDELLARVRALLRRVHGVASAVVRVADLEVDTRSKTVRRADRVIPLTAREYLMLEYLAMRAGQVVSRSEMWEHLYDMHDTTTSNVVDVYVGYLRNKVDKPFGAKLIHTRRGLGYMLAEEPQAEDR
jgi:two-component system copper resistance phosphate regulon response regulator CusR